MTALNLNTDLLLAPPFRKSGLFVFITHWLAWLLLHFIAFLPTFVNMRIVDWEHFLFDHLLLVTINFFLFYIVAFFLIPRMATLPRRWFWIVASSLVLAIIFTYLRFRLQTYYTEYLMNKNPLFNKFPRKASTDSLGFFSYRFRTYFQGQILTTVSVVVVAFAYRLLLLWFQQEKVRKELENQKLQAELSFLKMQVNPHFLFNALNNIYSLSVMEKSNKTGQSIMKLSDLMRYVLYEKEDAENRVSLDKEIRHINSYIDLQKLRYTEDIYVQFSIEGETQGQKIPPLLLFPLIENSCKHGIVKDPAKPVSIEIKVTDHVFDFSIHNFKNDYLKDETGGIGLENVRKRLALLFPNKHTLNIKETNEEFSVDLHLPL